MTANDAYEREMLRGAAEGDAEAGLAVLQLCRNGLDHGDLSPALRHYLAERLTDVLDGMPAARALCIEPEPKIGRPRDPFPEWQEHLGAFAAVLAQRGYSPKQIAIAMCEVRAAVHDKPLEESDAHKIRKKFQPMQRLDEDLLIGPAQQPDEGLPTELVQQPDAALPSEAHIGPYREKLADFLPLK